jgi:hypothetical protein
VICLKTKIGYKVNALSGVWVEKSRFNFNFPTCTFNPGSKNFVELIMSRGVLCTCNGSAGQKVEGVIIK